MEASPRILLVDADRNSQGDLTAELESAGLNVTATWSGIEALALLREASFALLLIDSYLPDMYIGKFFEEISYLAVQPAILVMGDLAVCQISSLGFQTLNVIDKSDCVRVIKTCFSKAIN